MLLFQWGTYYRAHNDWFDLDLTRQFIVASNDELFQLHLTARFDPTDELRGLGTGNFWCHSPAELDNFRAAIAASAAYAALRHRVPRSWLVEYEQGCGSS